MMTTRTSATQTQTSSQDTALSLDVYEEILPLVENDIWRTGQSGWLTADPGQGLAPPKENKILPKFLLSPAPRPLFPKAQKNSLDRGTGAGQPWGRRRPPSSGRTSRISLFNLFVQRLFNHTLSLNY